MNYALEHFKMLGFDLNIDDKSSDLVFEKDFEIIKVIALAATNTSESACIRGKGFNKQQVKINIGNALYEVARQKTATSNSHEKYLFVIPETKVYARIIKEISEGIMTLGIQVLVISDVGKVDEFY
ncbi:MAG: hypothetical protein WBA54_14590 [Acidaminobacteraceae bacterium]